MTPASRRPRFEPLRSATPPSGAQNAHHSIEQVVQFSMSPPVQFRMSFDISRWLIKAGYGTHAWLDAFRGSDRRRCDACGDCPARRFERQTPLVNEITDGGHFFLYLFLQKKLIFSCANQA